MSESITLLRLLIHHLNHVLLHGITIGIVLGGFHGGLLDEFSLFRCEGSIGRTDGRDTRYDGVCKVICIGDVERFSFFLRHLPRALRYDVCLRRVGLDGSIDRFGTRVPISVHNIDDPFEIPMHAFIMGKDGMFPIRGQCMLREIGDIRLDLFLRLLHLCRVLTDVLGVLLDLFFSHVLFRGDLFIGHPGDASFVLISLPLPVVLVFHIEDVVRTVVRFINAAVTRFSTIFQSLPSFFRRDHGSESTQHTTGDSTRCIDRTTRCSTEEIHGTLEESGEHFGEALSNTAEGSRDHLSNKPKRSSKGRIGSPCSSFFDRISDIGQGTDHFLLDDLCTLAQRLVELELQRGDERIGKLRDDACGLCIPFLILIVTKQEFADLAFDVESREGIARHSTHD